MVLLVFAFPQWYQVGGKEGKLAQLAARLDRHVTEDSPRADPDTRALVLALKLAGSPGWVPPPPGNPIDSGATYDAGENMFGQWGDPFGSDLGTTPAASGDMPRLGPHSQVRGGSLGASGPQGSVGDAGELGAGFLQLLREVPDSEQAARGLMQAQASGGGLGPPVLCEGLLLFLDTRGTALPSFCPLHPFPSQ